ncbi:unnamed protein product [Ceutorhynchus assimilis]|uniref:Phospholipase A2 n=1 Tax=Ceutorhynchus assimilis TaxID=467358 RepID=A0A9N9QIY8_9CUCU|nr:unnamed protein product [Ceutorhynchus assimilis]
MPILTLGNHVMVALFLLFCLLLEIRGKPSLGGLTFRGPFNADAADNGMGVLKQYSGRKIENSTRMVYFHDQTVAIVELGPRKLLLNCEIIEVFTPEDYVKVLGNDFGKVARPVGITFYEMITLMDQCKELDEIMDGLNKKGQNSTGPESNARGILSNDPFTLLKGIVPGTKWCGTGDIAKNYHDLGSEPTVDICCRTHDLCPVKVRSRSKKYQLRNNSIYTKSHCICDEQLYNCLKAQQSIPIANILGNIYFNLAAVECVDDEKEKRLFRRPRRWF